MTERKTYPLSFLFVLVTVSAVIIAIFVTLIPAIKDAALGRNTFLTAALGGGFAGGILGVIMGCYRIDRAYGILVCGTMGVLVGAAATCLVLVDEKSFPRLVTSQIGGSVLIVFLAAIVRFGVRKEVD